MKKLKLFVWTEVLTDYTDGIMFAIAHDVEEARKLVLDSSRISSGPAAFGEMLGNHDNKVERDLAGEPDVYDSPVGMYVWGGG